MFYYLLIGVHRSPWYSADDCDSFFPFLHNVQSELALTINELETAFELKVKNHWELLFDEALDDLSLEELQNCDPNNGYFNLDYCLVNAKPFDTQNINVYGADLCNKYLGC